MAATQEIVSAVVAMRKAAGMSQRDLAAAVGREQNYIARIETGGRRVDLVEFVVLCRACNVDPIQASAELIRSFSTLLPKRAGKAK